MKCAVAAFAKTPGLSPVKTRLAAEIGENLAEQFYRMSVEAVEDILLSVQSQSNNLIIPYWALAEIEGSKNKMWNSIPSIWTGDGDLGKRLFNVSRQMLKLYDCVMMTGTDSPQLDPQIFFDAYSMLKTSRDKCVIGPSIDGGFYLFGSSFQIPENIWTDVQYSRDDTLEQLLYMLKEAGIKHTLLEKMADADTFDDLKIISRSLQTNIGKNLPAQTKLSAWLDNLFKVT